MTYCLLFKNLRERANERERECVMEVGGACIVIPFQCSNLSYSTPWQLIVYKGISMTVYTCK